MTTTPAGAGVTVPFPPFPLLVGQACPEVGVPGDGVSATDVAVLPAIVVAVPADGVVVFCTFPTDEEELQPLIVAIKPTIIAAKANWRQEKRIAYHLIAQQNTLPYEERLTCAMSSTCLSTILF
jgi:hypothetical protein